MKYVYTVICILFILISEQVTAQWSNLTAPNFRHYNGVAVLDYQNIVAVGGNRTNDPIRTVITTINGGGYWGIYQDGINPWLKAVCFPNPGMGYAVGYAGTIIQTTNMGQTWTSLPTPGGVTTRDFNSIFFVNDSVGFIAGGHQSDDSIQGDDSMQTILKTIDRGASWTVQRDVMGWCLTSVFFTDANNGFAAGDRGTILKTTNGGANWTPVALTGNLANRNYNALYFTNSNTGFAVGGYPKNDSIRTILKTTDGGNNWSVVMDNLGHMLNAIDFSSGTTAYVVGNYGTAYNSVDTGNTWAPVSLPSGGVLDTMDLKAVDFLNADFGMVTGRFGKLLKYQSNVVSVPEVTTLAANKVGSTVAQLNMLTDPNGFATTRSFEYGTTTAFGNTVQLTGSIGGSIAVPDSVSLTGLVPNTFYYFRGKAVNVNGTSYGATKQFYTSDCEVPNCDFEVWDTVLIDKLESWGQSGIPHKVSSYNGSSAIQLGPTDQAIGLVDFGNENPTGGIPFAARPDSITLYAKYDIQVGDTGLVICVFKKNGTITAFNVFSITGNSGNNFVRLAFALQYPDTITPDSLMMAITNKNVFTENQPITNNYVTIDDVQFTGTNLVLPNWNLELWDTILDVRPNSWYSPAYIRENAIATVMRSSDPVTGQYAVHLRNRPERHTFLTVGDTATFDGPIFPVAGKHLTFNFFLKFFPQGTDSVRITLGMFKNDTAISYLQVIIDTPVLDYTPMSFDLLYNVPNVIPDSARISIEVGSQYSQGSSNAYIDNISFDGFRLPSGIKKPKENDMVYVLYPNPATSTLSVLFDQPGEYEVGLYDYTGRLLTSQTLSGKRGEMDISTFANGIYLVKISAAGKTAVRKLQILR